MLRAAQNLVAVETPPNSEATSLPGPTRHYKKATIEDAKRWAGMYASRISIVKIAKEEGVDPGTVSTWLKKAGVELKQGQHFVKQPPLSIAVELRGLLSRGSDEVEKLIAARMWGVQVSQEGRNQLRKYCEFLELYELGIGVNQISERIKVHRSTVVEWRNGTDMPYLVKLAQKASESPTRPDWKWMPLNIGSGGNEQSDWITVPSVIYDFSDIMGVLEQLPALETSQTDASRFGIHQNSLGSLKSELFGYLLGILVGDAGKRGGLQTRVSSMNMDLQLTKLESTNERLGEFVCFCSGLLGLEMHRVKDKPPSGVQLNGENPSFAFRWVSERSPLVAWMFNVCLGLDWDQNTSTSMLNMDWIYKCPEQFIKRFIQGMADSDGTVRRYTVEIASMPNAEFVTTLLRKLGLESAETIIENGYPMRSKVRIAEAIKIPMFNEMARSYRYVKLLQMYDDIVSKG